jgi:hypothetical protein
MARTTETDEVGAVMRAAIAEGESVMDFDCGRAALAVRLLAEHLLAKTLPGCVVATLGGAWAPIRLDVLAVVARAVGRPCQGGTARVTTGMRWGVRHAHGSRHTAAAEHRDRVVRSAAVEPRV